MNKFEEQYSALMREVLRGKNIVTGRNGKVRMKTAVQLRADLREGFPLVTGKRIFPKSIAVETEWFLKGLTSTKWLNTYGVKIWDQWADENGELGPVYGKQLRDFNGFDQLKEVVALAKEDPSSRRLVVNLWNPLDIDKMKLPPCHYGFQFVVHNKQIDVVVSMRSLDLFVGAPYDVAMYALILSSFTKELGSNYIAGEVVINAANAHIYEEHCESAATYVGRKKTELPKLVACPRIMDFNFNEVVVEGYNPKDRIIVKVKK